MKFSATVVRKNQIIVNVAHEIWIEASPVGKINNYTLDPNASVSDIPVRIIQESEAREIVVIRVLQKSGVLKFLVTRIIQLSEYFRLDLICANNVDQSVRQLLMEKRAPASF